MNITEMHYFFDLICDKVGSDYFSPTEKDVLINTAIQSVVNDYFYNAKKTNNVQAVPPYSIDSNSIITEALHPLIVEPVTVQLTSTSDILISSIESSMNGEFMHALNVSVLGDGSGCLHEDELYTYCRFVRHNDYYKHIKNAFKKPSAKHPTYRYFNGKIRINPSDTFTTAIVTPLKRPDIVSLSGNVDCNLPFTLHNEIMFRAVTFGGISMRERDLVAVAEQMKNENG